jgi:hypothetical protein
MIGQQSAEAMRGKAGRGKDSSRVCICTVWVHDEGHFTRYSRGYTIPDLTGVPV